MKPKFFAVSGFFSFFLAAIVVALQSWIRLDLLTSHFRFSSSLETDLLAPITESPTDFYVRRILTPSRSTAFLFGRSVKLIRADEGLLQEVILNIESNEEFVIKSRIRIMSSRPGTLFSIAHTQRKLFLLDLSSKGTGDKTRLILRYRSTNDTMETIVFKDVVPLGNSKAFHSVVIRITDVFEKGKKISALSLFVGCKFFGRVDTLSPISSIFSYRGTLLSLLDFRIGQRAYGKKVNTPWMVIYFHY